MKKIGLLTTLLVAGLLLTGCNKSVNVENEQERIFACGRSVSEYLGISDYSISWDKEEEAGASLVLNGRVNIGNGIDEERITKNVQCVVDMVDKSVTIQEVSYDLDEYPWELKDLYHTWHLVGFNHELTDISAELMFTDKIIGAKFCNDMGSDDYSIEGNTIHVKNMVQNEMLCDSEELMEYERKFDLSDAKINLVVHNLRITTSNGDVYDFYRNGYESEDEYNQFLEDIKSSGEQPQGKNNLNIPSFEELEDVVAMCPYEVMGGGYSEYPVYKREFIIPYKDGYIGYNYGGNGGGWGYYLTYKSLDKPCEIISYTDEFFYRHVHYKHDLEEYNEYEYPDNKVYLSQGGMGGIPMDIVEKELNCESGKDMNEDDTCKKEVDQFMYNLILGKEENETFTEWMDILKKSIDNTDYYTGSIWFNRWENCNKEFSWESLMKEYGEDTKNLSEEKRKEYRKIQINRIHNCLENLNK